MNKKRTDGPAGTPDSNQKPRRRRVKVKTGQIVAVPLRDGTYALGHVAQYTYLQAILAHFDHRATRPEELLTGAEEAMKTRLVAMLAVTSDEIYDGHWPVIGHKDPWYPPAMLDMKGTSHTANASRWFFDAYYGLVPWDVMAATPRYFEEMLLPGVPVPPTARYKRDFERDAAAATTPVTTTTPTNEATAKPPITEGRGVIHIEIKYPGEDLPSVELLHRRQAIENGLESAGVGTVTDAGGGGGVMDIFLETEDVARAMPFATAAVIAAGFEHDTRIEVEPHPDDDIDEEGN